MIDRENVNTQPFTRTRHHVLLPHRGKLVWQFRPKPRAFMRWAWHGCGRRYLRTYSVTLRGQCHLEINRCKYLNLAEVIVDPPWVRSLVCSHKEKIVKIATASWAAVQE